MLDRSMTDVITMDSLHRRVIVNILDTFLFNSTIIDFLLSAQLLFKVHNTNLKNSLLATA